MGLRAPSCTSSTPTASPVRLLPETSTWAASRGIPDGSGVSFLAKRGKDKHRSLYVIPIDGGEARKVLSAKSAISSYSWSPDGSRVAFIAADPPPKESEKLKEKGFNQTIYEEDYRPVRVHVARLSEADTEPRALELAGFPSELHWAPTEDLLAVALAPTPLVDDRYMNRKVHVVDADSGNVVARFENPGKLGQIAWSTDSKHLAFLSGEDIHDPSEGRLLVAPRPGWRVEADASWVRGRFHEHRLE